MRSPFARFWPRGQNNKSLKIRSGSPDHIEDILDHSIRDVRNLDPETERRWQFLARELEQRRISPEVSRRSRWVRPLRISVPIAAVAGAALLVVIFWPHGMVPESYQTSRGQQTTITLPDGSEVVLNHTSSLTLVDRTFVKSREVTLQGEALFRVRKNGTPFVVITEVASVRVLGTEFDVRMRDGMLNVGVLMGNVNVTAERGGKDSTVVLNGGEETRCAVAGYPGQPTMLSEPGYPGWLSGRMVFMRTPFSSVCREIESTYDVSLRVEDPRLRTETITGVLDAHNLGAALETLARLTGTRYRHEDSTYIFF